MKNNFKIFAIFLLGFITAGIIARFDYHPNYDTVSKYNQDVRNYAKNKIIDYDSKVSGNFLKVFFTPWTDDVHTKYDKLVEFVESLKEANFYDGLGNKYPYSFYEKIIENGNIYASDDIIQKGIVINRTDLRMLPSFDRFYDSPSHPSYGYPFDNLAYSSLKINTPIAILKTTKDKKFYLVSAFKKDIAWIKATDVRLVNEEEIEAVKSASFKTVLKEPIYTQEGKKLKIGTILPVLKNKVSYATGKGWEELLDRTHIADFPLKLENKKIAELAEMMQGVYAWGGIDGAGRDCSSLLQDLYFPFGIYIPRNSTQQSLQLDSVNIDHLSEEEKEEIIIKYAIPFRTILYLKGHVMLYIGVDEITKKPLVYHAIWGYKDYTIFGRETRKVIGKTIVSDMNYKTVFGKSLLSRIEKLLFI